MWNITARYNRDIELIVYYMDIEVGPTGECVFDHLLIRGGTWLIFSGRDLVILNTRTR